MITSTQISTTGSPKKSNNWGYEEYMEFCRDYSIRSTVLLTALQLSEIFLYVVPMDNDQKTIKMMNFTQFCQVLVCMSAVAFRDHSDVSNINKVIYY